MEQEKIDNYKAWFLGYVGGFYGEDEFVNANIRLKEEHSLKVCEQMLYLADELKLEPARKRLAEVIALFHDIGRFEQFARYRTYSDPRSLDHSLLGVEILRRLNVLDGVEPRQRYIIEKAIEYHGLTELPAGIDDECLLFARLIRDADKLDIYRVVIDYYAEYQKDPQSFKLEVELPDEPWYSHDVLQDVLAGRKINYKKLRTWNDMKIAQAGWVYDVNFAAALKRIKQYRFLEKVFDFLPDDAMMKALRETVLGYVDERIEKNR